MGLAISSTIAESHGGRLWATSNPEGGRLFPLHYSRSFKEDSSHDNKEPTVFVVDDDEDARDSVCVLVRSMGIRAEPFASAEEFLA